MKTATSNLPRHLVLRDPRDGRTLRIAAYQNSSGRYVLSLDFGTTADGGSIIAEDNESGGFAAEAVLQQRLSALLASYCARGYEIFSDRSGGPLPPAPAPAWLH